MITIPVNTTFIGELRSAGRLRIDGRFEGTACIDGLLLLTHTCVWKGKISADIVVIEGTVEGDIFAKQRVEISANADVSGNIVTPEISIARGGKVTADIRMAAPEPPIGIEDLRIAKVNAAEAVENKADKQEAAVTKKIVGA